MVLRLLMINPRPFLNRSTYKNLEIFKVIKILVSHVSTLKLMLSFSWYDNVYMSMNRVTGKHNNIISLLKVQI